MCTAATSNNIVLYILQGDDDYLGTVEAKPVVRMTQDAAIASLGWYSVRHLDSNVGQLLAAFELIRVCPSH